MNTIAALVLAAGKGSRMKSQTCKVLHEIAGKSMIAHVLSVLETCAVDPIVLVVGRQSDRVREAVTDDKVRFAEQDRRLGTGHAVLCAKDVLHELADHVLILCGDTPLIRSATLNAFMEYHHSLGSKLTLMTGFTDTPHGYGRIVRNGEGAVSRIVEEKDASDQERTIKEVNTGVYLVERGLLFGLLEHVTADNSQGEYYLTDIVAQAIKASINVNAYAVNDFREVIGINTRAELAAASNILWDRTRRDLMEAGVTILDPTTVYIDAGVKVGVDTIIEPCVHIRGATVIGTDCKIESGVYIINATIHDNVAILQGSRVNGAVVSHGAVIGPMAHLRPEADIGPGCKIGNFVEVKKTHFGAGSKASHLSYLGDSVVGTNVNIGCGVITCNYDGKRKHPTTIGDNCFVGSDVQFVAPVKVGQGCVIGAGSTITKDVPEFSLAVARGKQKSYPLRKGQGSTNKDEDRQS